MSQKGSVTSLRAPPIGLAGSRTSALPLSSLAIPGGESGPGRSAARLQEHRIAVRDLLGRLTGSLECPRSPPAQPDETDAGSRRVSGNRRAFGC
jgi:hypothetical protein